MGETKCVGCLGGPGLGALRKEPAAPPWVRAGAALGHTGRGVQVWGRRVPACAPPGQPPRTEACHLSQAQTPPPPRRGVPTGLSRDSTPLRLGRLGSFPWEGGPATYPTSCVHSRFQRRLALVAELRASPRPGRLPAVRPSRGHGPCCGHPFIRLPRSSCRAGARLPSHPWLASWGQCLAGGCGVNGGRWGHREGGLPSHRLPHCFCSLVILLFV